MKERGLKKVLDPALQEVLDGCCVVEIEELENTEKECRLRLTNKEGKGRVRISVEKKKEGRPVPLLIFNVVSNREGNLLYLDQRTDNPSKVDRKAKKALKAATESLKVG